MLLKTIYGFSHNTFLIIQETQFKERVSLGLFIFLFMCYLEEILKVLYGRMDVSIFGVGFSQLSMGLTCFLFIVSRLTQLEEFVQHLDGFVEIAQFLVNVTYFLVALGFLLLVLSSLWYVEAFLEELQTLLEIVLILKFTGDDLVYLDKLAADLFFQFLKRASFNGSFQSGLEATFGVENIEDILFADTKTHVSFGFSLDVLSLNTDVEAFLVEVWGSFIVYELLELLCDSRVLLNAIFDLVIAVKLFGILKILAEGQELFLLIFVVFSYEFSLLSLVKFVFFLKFGRGLDFRWGSLSGDIEEVDVGLQVSLLHELDRLWSGCNFLFKFEIVILLLEVGAATRHVLLVLRKTICQRLLAVFLDDLRFGLVDKFVLLFALGLLLDLPDLGVGVINWSQFHICLFFINWLYYKFYFIFKSYK